MPTPYEPLSYTRTPAPPPAAAEPRRRSVSGRRIALIVGALLLLAAVAAPFALRRALWVDVEVVLALWFCIWTGAMWWLGYHGRAVTRDWPAYAPLWKGDGRGDGDRSATGLFSGLGDLDLSGLDGGDGCGAAIAVVILLALAAVLIGWVIPLLVFLLFTVMRVLLSQARRRSHRVRGRLLASLVAAAGWAAVYTVPLAIAVWALHALT